MTEHESSIGSSDGSIMLLALVLAVPSCIGYTLWNRPIVKTEKLIDAQARLACSSERIAVQGLKDYWNTETQTEVVEDGNGSLFCTVTSAGRDTVIGTEDDLVAKHQDINKSRIAGAWMKAKGVEAIKGVIYGDRSDEQTKQ